MRSWKDWVGLALYIALVAFALPGFVWIFWVIGGGFKTDPLEFITWFWGLAGAALVLVTLYIGAYAVYFRVRDGKWPKGSGSNRVVR